MIDRRYIIFNKPIINTLDWKPNALLKFASIPVINEALNFESDTVSGALGPAYVGPEVSGR